MCISFIDPSFTITFVAAIPAHIFSKYFGAKLNKLPICIIYFSNNSTTGSFVNYSFNSFLINFLLSFLRFLLFWVLNGSINITSNNLLSLLKVIMLFLTGYFLMFFLSFSSRLQISIFLVNTLLVTTPELPFTYFHVRCSSIRPTRFLKTSTQNYSWPLLKQLCLFMLHIGIRYIT